VGAVVQDFVQVMESFFFDFVPQRAAAAAAAAAQVEAFAALGLAEAGAALASQVQSFKAESCTCAEDVAKAAEMAARQLQFLGERGLAMPSPHVEFVREAVDRAGAMLLSSPPSPQPISRLRWSESAMAVQLALVAPFRRAFIGIAKAVDVEDVKLQLNESKGCEAESLLAATFWVLQRDCRCDASWEQCVQMLQPSTTGTFSERLAAWWPSSTDSEFERLHRARELLCKVWAWAARGCGGSLGLGQLYAWVALAVELTPLADIEQKLEKVHQAVCQNVAKVERASPEQQPMAAAKGWTATLFLLDTPAQPWWWLGLIRSGVAARPPWMDFADGGVGMAEGVAEGETMQRKDSAM